jgi:hypothetical protein
VHVLVGRDRREGAAHDVVAQPPQGVDHRGQLGVGEQPRAVQHPGVRDRPRDVVRRQPPVEVRAEGQRGQRVGRA